MAFPWIFENNFENTVTPFGWDSEEDTGGLLDVPTYLTLAQSNVAGNAALPYRGASCMRIVAGDTNDHTLTEADLDIADGATAFASFYLYIGTDFLATANDTFNIYEFSEAAAIGASLSLRITATTDAVEIGIGDGVVATDFSTGLLAKGRWYHIEVGYFVSTGGAGTLTLYVDGVSRVALTTLTGNAVTSGRLGTQDTLSTTTGTLLFDEFKFDDLQVFPNVRRFPDTMTLTQSGHVFVGPGSIDSATLMSTTAGNTMWLYDTDRFNTDQNQDRVVELDIAAHTTMSAGHQPIHFLRGCYVELAGTNPRGTVTISRSTEGPHYYSAAGMRQYGNQRKVWVPNV